MTLGIISWNVFTRLFSHDVFPANHACFKDEREYGPLRLYLDEFKI